MALDPAIARAARDFVAQRQAQMRERTIALAQINSGSFNAEGVNRVREALAEMFAELGAQAEVLSVEPWQALGDDGQMQTRPLGDALRLRKRPEAPFQVFLCGHMDTVFAADHPFQQVRELDADTLNGPGVADLKGGLVLMQTALAALEASPLAEHIGWEVLLNPDEEIGSQSSAPLIAEAARRCHVGLIYEPSFPDGHLAGARKGSGNFTLVVRGRAAHAGREHHLGRNALVAASRFATQLDALNGEREGVTFNIGKMDGGGPVNIVPDLAVVRFNVRMPTPDDMDWAKAQIERLADETGKADGIGAALHGGFTRPPKPMAPPVARMFDFTHRAGQAIGLDINWNDTGGVCEGDNLWAAGCPNVDTLGVRGGDIHNAKEFAKLDSFGERARLSAVMLMKFASGEFDARAAREAR